MSPRNRRSGVSLLEVVAAVSIAVSLAAVLLPVVARARESGRRTTCKSNLHQIGLGLALYRQDYDGVDACLGHPLSHSALGLPYSWSALQRYIRSRKVWFCPSWVRTRADSGSSYWEGYLESELSEPWRDFEALAAARGPDYPTVICPSHNGPELPPGELRYAEPMLYQVLRIDGRVTVNHLPAYQSPSLGRI